MPSLFAQLLKTGSSDTETHLAAGDEHLRGISIVAKFPSKGHVDEQLSVAAAVATSIVANEGRVRANLHHWRPGALLPPDLSVSLPVSVATTTPVQKNRRRRK